MNKLILTILMVIFLTLPAFSREAIQAGVELDWPLLNQEARDKTINHYREMLFKDIKYKVDKSLVQSKKKDPKVGINKAYLKKGLRKLHDRELAGFYLLNKLLVIYGIKYNNDKQHIYYYNAAGRLEYFDILNKSYDQYPYIAYKYKKNGKLKEVSYYISDHDQYVFDKKGKFKGRWYGERLYDKKAKVIMTRRLP